MLVIAATAAVFSLSLAYPFLNWDDADVFLRNDALRAPGFVAWAFTTRYMEHYQPLAWLAWGALERTVGLTAASAHALNVALHAACAAFVYLFVRRHAARWAAAAAALFWAIHPLRVEVVAWASAMPYTLALLFALWSMLAWLGARTWTAVGLFAASLFARPIAMALPIVWMVIATKPSAEPGLDKRQQAGVGAALAIAVLASLAEASARLTASLTEFGPGPRLTLAAVAPWHYLWRTIVPAGLTPLDPLALAPRTDLVAIAAGIAATAVLCAAAWRWRRQHPVLSVSWLGYLALLVPATGLLPSGLQATADRYTYIPAVAVSLAIAVLLGRAREAAFLASGVRRKVFAAAGAAVVAAFAVLTWDYIGYWRDSVALWTRAVEVDARNDIALYNLGSALDEAGRTDEALARYEQALAIVPDHAEARRNRNLIYARRLEEEGNRLAAAGNLADAVPQYVEAVRLDPRRTHSHAALGMALTQLGRTREAQVPLRTAIDQGVNDPAVPNALAFGLSQAGDRDGALSVLRAAQRRFPNDENIARNLARLAGRRE